MVRERKDKAHKASSSKPAKSAETALKKQATEGAPITKQTEKKVATNLNFKVFDKWDTTNIVVKDVGLKRYMNLRPVYVPLTYGRTIGKQFWKSKKPLVERLINKMAVTGHKGKKHWRTSAHNTGKLILLSKIVDKSFDIIANRTKQNPIEVLVRAIETGSPKEGITTIEYGGVRYPKAVDLAPQRRIDLALRWITQGAYQESAANKTKSISEALANQLILTMNNDNKSVCIQKKVELERQAATSR